MRVQARDDSVESTKHDPIRFTYYRNANTVLLGDDPLIKGVPAKLLARILKDYVGTQKRMFFLSEFRTLKDILGQRPNLEARLGRLSKRLEERSGRVRLLRMRGARIFWCDGPVEFVEI